MFSGLKGQLRYTTNELLQLILCIEGYTMPVVWHFSCFVVVVEPTFPEGGAKRWDFFQDGGSQGLALGSLVWFSFLVTNWFILSCVWHWNVSPVLLVAKSAVIDSMWLGLSFLSPSTGGIAAFTMRSLRCYCLLSLTISFFWWMCVVVQLVPQISHFF